MNRRRCPVCFRRVDKTRLGNIAGHMDTAIRCNPCPGSHHPYSIALADDMAGYEMSAGDVKSLWFENVRGTA